MKNLCYHFKVPICFEVEPIYCADKQTQMTKGADLVIFERNDGNELNKNP